MFCRQCIAYLLASLFFSSVYAAGGEPKDAAVLEYKQIFSAQWNAIIERYRQIPNFDGTKLLPGPERPEYKINSILSEIQLEIGDEQDIDRVYGYYKNGKPTVHVSAEFIIVSSMASAVIADSLAEAYRKDPGNQYPNIDMNNAISYAEFLASQIALNRDRRSRGLEKLNYTNYFSWIGLDATQQWNRQYQLYTSEAASLVGGSATGFVIGHEIGHFVLGHVGHPIGAKEESEADDFSTEINYRSDLLPIVAIGNLVILDYFERNEATSATTHPPAQCRAVQALFKMIAFERGVGELKARVEELIDKYRAGYDEMIKLDAQCNQFR